MAVRVIRVQLHLQNKGILSGFVEDRRTAGKSGKQRNVSFEQEYPGTYGARPALCCPRKSENRPETAKTRVRQPTSARSNLRNIRIWAVFHRSAKSRKCPFLMAADREMPSQTGTLSDLKSQNGHKPPRTAKNRRGRPTTASPPLQLLINGQTRPQSPVLTSNLL